MEVGLDRVGQLGVVVLHVREVDVERRALVALHLVALINVVAGGWLVGGRGVHALGHLAAVVLQEGLEVLAH